MTPFRINKTRAGRELNSATDSFIAKTNIASENNGELFVGGGKT